MLGNQSKVTGGVFIDLTGQKSNLQYTLRRCDCGSATRREINNAALLEMKTYSVLLY